MNYAVHKGKDGLWVVRKVGSKRASAIGLKKPEAVALAKRYAKASGGQFVLTSK